MKNNYSFNNLSEKKPCELINKNELFLKMRNLTMNGAISHFGSIDEIDKYLQEGSYFVIHNMVVYKGKTPFLKGLFLVTSKGSLIKFLKQSIEIDDLRDLLIAPQFVTDPLYVMQVNDGVFYLCK
ncbi:hypothetical protein [Lonsdalea quercina]|uniref:hypothetical protein n=1 Tax=Lonsdalea quercina TaxID=71657 RepID=UPI003974CAE6